MLPNVFTLLTFNKAFSVDYIPANKLKSIPMNVKESRRTSFYNVQYMTIEKLSCFSFFGQNLNVNKHHRQG